MDEQVMTVLGPVAPAELGVTDGHSHVWIEPVAGGAADAPVLNDAAAIGQELRAYKAAGGGAVVDCQPGECGRNGRFLPTLSRASGVHLIACTGFHLRRYYPPDAPLWQLDAERAAAYFISELSDGLRETQESGEPVRAGFLKIAGEESLAKTPRPLLEAAAIAGKATGCAIEMHTERGTAVEEFLRFFLDRGVAPERLIFCHVDKRPDFAFHQNIAQSGPLLEYDTFFRPKYRPEENVWPLLAKMIAAGLGGQIVLATDLADSGLWTAFGGQPGMAAFVTQIGDRLKGMGLANDLIHNLTGGNIARRLAKPLTQEGVL
jgi:5-phospho-D-xylono-1,4-lactonase